MNPGMFSLPFSQRSCFVYRHLHKIGGGGVATWRGIPGRDLRGSWREKEDEGKRKTEMTRERCERDVMYVWSRFTLSSPYHETSPGGDNHTAADVCVCKRMGCNSP